MIKKDASLHLLGLARSIQHSHAGDEDAEVWILQLLWIAEGLDPKIIRHPKYEETLFAGGDSRQTKLRRLIEHPRTSPVEREAAVRALTRIRTQPEDADEAALIEEMARRT